MTHIRTICICTALAINAPTFSVSIIGGAKSLLGKVTSTFQRGVSSAIPDVEVCWEDDNRVATLNDTQRVINETVHTVAHDLRSLVSELHNVSDETLETALSRLDGIINKETEHAGHQLKQAIAEIDTLLNRHEAELDARISDIHTRFYDIVVDAQESITQALQTCIADLDERLEKKLDYAQDRAQHTLSQAVRQIGYVASGISCAGTGLYIAAQLICQNTAYSPWHYSSSGALILAALFLIGESDALAEKGLCGYPSSTSEASA